MTDRDIGRLMKLGHEREAVRFEEERAEKLSYFWATMLFSVVYAWILTNNLPHVLNPWYLLLAVPTVAAYYAFLDLVNEDQEADLAPIWYHRALIFVSFFTMVAAGLWWLWYVFPGAS